MIGLSDNKKKVALGIALILFIISFSSSVYGLYRIRQINITYEGWMDATRANLKEVRNQTFSNEVIELDGKHLHDCVLQNSTLIYRGKQPYILEHNTILGTIRIKVTYGPQMSGLALVYALKDVCNTNPAPCSFEGVTPDLQPLPHF